MEVSGSYSHLKGRALEVVAKPDEARIAYIRSERWIGYPRALGALQKLEELYAWPKRGRMPNLAIIGPTNAGKSFLISKFRRNHPDTNGELAQGIPVLVVEMPPVPTVASFYMALLDELGAPYRSTSRAPELERMALRLIRDTRVRILVIDELHNILAASSTARREFLNVLRYLGNQLQIPLVASGTRDAYLAIRSDPQLENRFEPYMLHNWVLGNDFLKLLASFQAMLPLRRPSEIVSDEMAEYLLARSEGTTGELADLISKAAVAAILSGEESINAKSLAEVDYQGPSVRVSMGVRSVG
jgi:hypothetical protein